MSIVIFTKSTPDTAAKVEVNPQGTVTWGSAQLVLNPWDEYAVTEAVLLKEAHKVKATAVSIGGDANNDALKQALAIGVDEAVRVWDASMEGHDSLVYAAAAAGAIRKVGDVSLIIFGKEFADLQTDAHVYQIARKLGWPVIGSVSKITAIDFAAKTIRVERMIEEGKQTVTAKLPAVIAVLKDINEPKSPSFIGIRKASKATIPVWSAADVGLNVAARAKVTTYTNPPARSGAVQIVEGATDAERAAKLVEKLLGEKVI